MLPQSAKQRSWDRPLLKHVMDEMANSLSSATDKARWRAVSAPHAGDWLLDMLIALCWLKLDDEAVRVAMGIRLGGRGEPLQTPHMCQQPASHCARPSRPLMHHRLLQTSETWRSSTT